jgi:hypothetical protein
MDAIRGCHIKCDRGYILSVDSPGGNRRLPPGESTESGIWHIRIPAYGLLIPLMLYTEIGPIVLHPCDTPPGTCHFWYKYLSFCA